METGDGYGSRPMYEFVYHNRIALHVAYPEMAGRYHIRQQSSNRCIRLSYWIISVWNLTLLLQPDAYGTSANDGEKICMLKLRSYLNKPLVEIIRQKGIMPCSLNIFMPRITFRNVLLSHARHRAFAAKLYQPKIPLLRISKLKEYDEYYRPESELKTLPLPVYKVEVDNKTQVNFIISRPLPRLIITIIRTRN